MGSIGCPMDGPSLTMPRDVFDNGAAFIEDFGVQNEKVLENVSCFSNEYILLT